MPPNNDQFLAEVSKKAVIKPAQLLMTLTEIPAHKLAEHLKAFEQFELYAKRDDQKNKILSLLAQYRAAHTPLASAVDNSIIAVRLMIQKSKGAKDALKECEAHPNKLCVLEYLRKITEEIGGDGSKVPHEMLASIYLITSQLLASPQDRVTFDKDLFYFLKFIKTTRCEKITTPFTFDVQAQARRGALDTFSQDEITKQLISVIKEILARENCITPFVQSTRAWIQEHIKDPEIDAEYARLDAFQAQIPASHPVRMMEEEEDEEEEEDADVPLNQAIEKIKIEQRAWVDAAITDDKTEPVEKLKQNLEHYKKEIKQCEKSIVSKSKSGADYSVEAIEYTRLNVIAACALESLIEIYNVKGVHHKSNRDGFFMPKLKSTYVNELASEARTFFEKSSKHFNPAAFFEVGYRYYRGETFEKHAHWARVYLEKACDAQNGAIDLRAYYALAKMYFYGEGGEINVKEAKRLIDQIAKSFAQNPKLLAAYVETHELLYFQAELKILDYFEYLHQSDQEAATQAIDAAVNLYIKSLDAQFTSQAFLSLLVICEREALKNTLNTASIREKALDKIIAIYPQGPEVVSALGLDQKLARKEKHQFYFLDYLLWVARQPDMATPAQQARINALDWPLADNEPSEPVRSDDAKKMLEHKKGEQNSLLMRRILFKDKHDQSAAAQLTKFYTYHPALLVDTYFFELDRKNHTAAEILKPIVTEVMDVTDPNNRNEVQEKNASMEYKEAVRELNAHGNTYFLRKIALAQNSAHANDARVKLQDYFNLNNNYRLLLTILLYEMRRHPFQSVQIKSLVDFFAAIPDKPTDEDFSAVRDTLNSMGGPGILEAERFEGIETLEKIIMNAEAKENTYFDDNLSDDSEPETDKVRQKSDPLGTTSKGAVSDLVNANVNRKSMVSLATDLINKISKDTAAEKDILGVFLPHALHGLVANKNSKDIQKDLITLNYYAAKGEAGKAMGLIKTKFMVAQIRGIHFYTDRYSKKDRNEYVRLTRAFERGSLEGADDDHPLKQNAVYSEAVYEHAGCADWCDLSPLTVMRLAQSNRFVYKKILEAMDEVPYQQEDLPLAQKFSHRMIASHEKKAGTLRNQVQDLYTADYQAHKDFLKWESAAKATDVEDESPASKKYFVNEKSPFISTADAPSAHGSRYAMGSKIYAGHEDENRMRPRYDHHLRAHRSYVGALELCLIPVEHLAYRSVNHVPSMAYRFDVDLRPELIHERESTFLEIQKGDVLYVLPVRFPSFHHKTYLPSFLPRYGLTKDLYFAFQAALQKTQPHATARRQLILLLGEYIGAYLTKRLCQMAAEKASHAQAKGILIYRTPEGVFSLFPYDKILPFPNGDKNRFVRQHSKFEQHARTGRNDLLEEEGEDFELESDESDEEGVKQTPAKETPAKRRVVSTAQQGMNKRLRKMGESSGSKGNQREDDDPALSSRSGESATRMPMLRNGFSFIQAPPPVPPRIVFAQDAESLQRKIGKLSQASSLLFGLTQEEGEWTVQQRNPGSATFTPVDVTEILELSAVLSGITNIYAIDNATQERVLEILSNWELSQHHNNSEKMTK